MNNDPSTDHANTLSDIADDLHSLGIAFGKTGNSELRRTLCGMASGIYQHVKSLTDLHMGAQREGLSTPQAMVGSTLTGINEASVKENAS